MMEDHFRKGKELTPLNWFGAKMLLPKSCDSPYKVAAIRLTFRSATTENTIDISFSNALELVNQIYQCFAKLKSLPELEAGDSNIDERLPDSYPTGG